MTKTIRKLTEHVEIARNVILSKWRGQSGGIVRATHQACAAASTVVGDNILLPLMRLQTSYTHKVTSKLYL
jgi:hypothetical protein